MGINGNGNGINHHENDSTHVSYNNNGHSSDHKDHCSDGNHKIIADMGNGHHVTAIAKFKIKSRLQNGDILYAMSINGFSPIMAEISGFAGYDVGILDLEHGYGGITEALSCIQAFKAADIPVIVRVPELSHVWVKKILDLGPQGIIFPMINDAESAKRAVSYCWYPPHGTRGVATEIVRASRYGMDGDYKSQYPKDLLILCQVETEEAVNNVEAIAGVEGVDGIMVGPLDLSASIGCMSDPTNDKVKQIMRKIEKTVLNFKRKEGGGPYLCGFAVSFDGPENFRNRGYQLIRGASDVALFRTACLEDVKKFKSKKVNNVNGIH